MGELLNSEDVAAMFCRSRSWLYKNYKHLHQERKFPLPVKINGYNIQWKKAAVKDWFAITLDNPFQTNDNAPGVCYEKLLAANAAVL